MADQPAGLVQGTLDMLILKTLDLQPMHGWGIAQRIRQMSGGVFEINPGSLFPAFRRLERAGLRIVWAEEYLRSRAADRGEAKLLNVRAGIPVMDVLRLTRYEGDRLMEVVRSVLLGDRYTYIAYLERHPAAAGLGGLVTHAREEEVARR